MPPKGSKNNPPRKRLNLQAEPIIDADPKLLRDPVPVFPDREGAFIDAYFVTGCNATKAAVMAGYSQEHAKVAGHTLLRKDSVRDEIGRRLSEHHAGAEEVLGVLSLHLRADLGLLLNDKGEFDWSLAVSRGVTRMIKKLKIKETRKQYNEVEIDDESDDVKIIPDTLIERTYELELHDPQAAAKVLVDVLGLAQKPKENDSDRDRKTKIYERMVDRVIERSLSEGGRTMSRSEAINEIVKYEPEIKGYVN